jgi:hypothetical protein
MWPFRKNPPMLDPIEGFPIVYHGSREPGLEELEPSWPPPGGLGFGIYVAFNPAVAEFYGGGHIYKLRLKLKPEEIFVIDSADYENFTHVPGSEGTSVLVGECVPPFAFRLREGDNDDDDALWVTVSNDEDIASRVAWMWLVEEIESDLGDDPLSVALDWYIRKMEHNYRAGSLDDFIEDIEEYIDWDETGVDTDDDGACEVFAAELADEAVERYGALEDEYVQRAQKMFGYVVDLMDVGAEVEHYGYKALYVEGIRGGFPDTELLVFDPDALEMICEME